MKHLSLYFFVIFFQVNTLFAQQVEKELIYFDIGKSEANLSSKENLNALLSRIKNKTVTGIKLTGHTDSDGSDNTNSLLSKKRTVNIAAYLLANGIEEDKISIANFGEQNPLSSNTTADGKRQNRCVEITVTYGFAIPENFKVAGKTFTINPNKDTVLTINTKGTVIHIQKNSFVDSEGNLIKKPVTLRYREYTNSAEIAFSDICMTYQSNGQEYRFNSSGMFELQGYTNNAPVHIALNKALKVDYALAKKNPAISFFKLNEKNTNWKKIEDIKPIKKGPVESQETSTLAIVPAGTATVSEKRQRHLKGGVEKGDFQIVDNGNRKNGTLLAAGADVGHTYPDIVKGLNVDSFGVYNCDQIYRLANRVQINARYVDADGREITDLHVLSLIDLKYNGAFSFDPKNFTCDAKAPNVLALFTKTGDLYLLDKTEFAKLNISSSGQYTFKMKNVTNEIKSSKDLAVYLGIKI